MNPLPNIPNSDSLKEKNTKGSDNKMEKWKEIKNFESLYEVSDIGNVRNKKTKKLISKRCDKDGYEIVNLYNLGKIKTAKVHRLVAEAFLENIENKPCVDHINTIKNDNRLENLRWCTYKENSNNILTKDHLKQGIRKGENHPFYGKHLSEETKRKLSEANKGENSSSSKKVEIFKENISLGVFPCTMELERKSEDLFGIKLNRSNICAVCRGVRSSHKGYTFRYVE